MTLVAATLYNEDRFSEAGQLLERALTLQRALGDRKFEGMSVTSLGILGLYNPGNSRMSGEIHLDGQELVGASPDAVRALRADPLGDASE